MRSLNPGYKTTRFKWNYGGAKLLLEDLKKEDVRPETKEYVARLVQKKMAKMAVLDPGSPLLKEIEGEFYNVKVETVPDTAVSSELKEWKELSKRVEDAGAEEEKEGKRSYVYAGFVLLMIVITLFISVQEIFGKGAIVKGLFDIVIVLVGGLYVVKKCLPRREKKK